MKEITAAVLQAIILAAWPTEEMVGIFSAPAVEADDEDDAEDPLRPPPEDGLASSSFFMREWFVLLLKFLRCIEFVPTVRLCHCDPPQQCD